jgi:hypothetical protein
MLRLLSFFFIQGLFLITAFFAMFAYHRTVTYYSEGSVSDFFIWQFNFNENLNETAQLWAIFALWLFLMNSGYGVWNKFKRKMSTAAPKEVNL